MIYTRKLHDINPAVLAENARYLAALIDGEGSFCLRVSNEGALRFTPLISLQMTHKLTVVFAADVFGVTHDISKKTKTKKYYKTVYRSLVTTRPEIAQIARALEPHAITKRRQIELMLNFFEVERQEANSGQSWETLQKKIESYIELKKCNERGPPKNYELMTKRLYRRAIRYHNVKVPELQH